MKTPGIIAAIIVLLIAALAGVKSLFPKKEIEITVVNPPEPVQHVPLAGATVFF